MLANDVVFLGHLGGQSVLASRLNDDRLLHTWLLFHESAHVADRRFLRGNPRQLSGAAFCRLGVLLALATLEAAAVKCGHAFSEFIILFLQRRSRQSCPPAFIAGVEISIARHHGLAVSL